MNHLRIHKQLAWCCVVSLLAAITCNFSLAQGPVVSLVPPPQTSSPPAPANVAPRMAPVPSWPAVGAAAEQAAGVPASVPVAVPGSAPAQKPAESHTIVMSPPAACSTIGPMSPCPVKGFHCVGCESCRKGGKKGWAGAGPIPWQAFDQGEYIGPARLGARTGVPTASR